MSLGLTIVATPVAAIGTCRFIEAKAERAADDGSSQSKTFDQLPQMRRDDEAVYRSMRGICRGC